MPDNAIQILASRMEGFGNKPAIYWRGRVFSYADLMARIEEWRGVLADKGLGPGDLVVVHADYSPAACALSFALAQAGAIQHLITPDNTSELESQISESGAGHIIRVGADDDWTYEALDTPAPPPLIRDFLAERKAGLILFTSGSTGKAKGILHDMERVMDKFVPERKPWRTVMFLVFDHFGGFNTMLSVFAYGGMAVCLRDRSVEEVCRVIGETEADLLPTTPTFLNFLLGSKAVKSHDLSSIERISYGTEMMLESTLERLNAFFPNAAIVNTYGLSELGVLRTKSKSSDSPWVKIGGQGFETKIIDDVLWVRAHSRMVGYFNAPDQFDHDGWMCTGDRVEVDGEYVRFLGRRSDIINVGGQKVSAHEVEEVILRDGNVLEVSAYGVPNELLGEVIVAEVSLKDPEGKAEATKRLKTLCKENLSRLKVPARFRIVDAANQHNLRFKKIRPVAS